MSLNPSWQFPESNGGIDVVRDPSSTHFSGSPLSNAVREVIQNSLDARQDGLDMVTVTFAEVLVPRDIIGAEGLRLHLEQCRLRADSEGRTSIRASFERALKTLEADDIRCLRIHDTGTTGLRNANWDALVLQEGAVEKQNNGTAPGGSYGIGKNAVLNISDLMTVFYSTRYVEGRKGRVQKLQGKATLMTHPDPEMPLNGSVQHIGFYRTADRDPITGVREIPDVFQMDETGTGIYVAGFNPRCDDWIGETRAAVITNFFHAIHNQRLQVAIKKTSDDEVLIDRQTLDIEFQRFAPESPAHQYYRAISGQRQSLMTTLDAPSPIGRLDIYLLTGEGPRRTAYVNQNGMLVSDSRDQRVNPLALMGRSLWPDYAAVVIPATKKGAAFLAEMENPSHNALLPNQLMEQQDRKRAAHALQAARTAMRSYIDDVVSVQQGTGLSNITELSHLFPELEYLFDQKFTTHVIPDSEVVTTLDEPPGEPVPKPAPAANSQSPTIKISQPRIIPTDTYEAVLAFTLSGWSRDNVRIVLRPAGEEPMSQKLIFVKRAEVLSPPDRRADAMDGVVHLTEPFEGRMTLRVVTSTEVERLAIQMEIA